MSSRIAVVGGGLAGISAALQCLEDGHQVVLLEARSSLGGLTTSFRRGSLLVDNGQHVFLRCCTAYRGLLERLGVQEQVTLQERLAIDVLRPGQGKPARLRRNSLPAPLHLGGSLLRYSSLGPVDRLRAVRGALALRRLDPLDATLDQQTFGGWLAKHGQASRVVDALWDLFAVATLNARSTDASLALAAKVFQTGLLTDASAGDIGWSLVPLDQLHGQASMRRLLTAGAEVRTRTKVARLERRPADWVVHERDGQRHQVDGVVLAVPPAQAEALLPAGSLDLERGWSARLGSSPIVNVHVVLDRPVMDAPFVAAIGTPAQWVFDRTAQSGLPTGQYLAVSISAADDLIDVETARIRERVLPAVLELFPAGRQARVLDFFVTRERHATFRPAPGTARLRAGARTRHPGLVLAGAWTDTGWPATMESAVLSGEAAAAALGVGGRINQQTGAAAA
jgi:squalene-associated FAD-dependent desaturase